MSDVKSPNESSQKCNDLDELIADTNSLIASVYSILEQPRRTPTAAPSSLLGRRSHNNSESEQNRSNLNSPASPKTPRLGIQVKSSLSTPSSQEIDREINRIDRFCEMLEQNLRSVSPAQQSEGRLDSASFSSTNAALRSPMITPPRRADQQTSQRRSPTPEAVIDLCDSMYVPTRRRPCSLNTSDDVMIVTPSVEEIVDLCTPTFHRNIARSRNHCRRTVNLVGGNSSNSIPNSNTVRLMPSRRSQSSISSQPSSPQNIAVSKERTGLIQNQPQSINTPGARSQNMNLCEANDSGAGRLPFMCAVCMESCVNNQPTSTKCGHVYCSNCIRQAVRLTRKCPMCNTKVTTNQLFRIYI